MNSNNTTIIICCAGMGTRLGIGTTKALVDICGKPLIIRMIENLNEYDDVRIVVGYKAESVIKAVNEYRKDIMFVFNYDYETTGPATSMWKALLTAKDNVIVIDGDLIIDPKSFKELLQCQEECVAYTLNNSDEPLFANLINDRIVHFSKKPTKNIWPGIFKIKKNKIKKGNEYIFETISEYLPIKALEVNVMEIDTQDDYERAIKWFLNNYNN